MRKALAAMAVVTALAFPEAERGAVLRSALIPGWGQHYLGHEGRGNIFLGVEAVTWAGIGYSILEGSLSTDDYEDLALGAAGIDASGLDDDMLDDMADFGSTEEFNVYIRRLARYYYPDDPVAQQQYYERNARGGGETWNWSSDEERERFADALKDSREWYRVAIYAGAFAVVNRAVSAIDAALLDREEQVLYSSFSIPDPDDFSSVRLTIGARF
jgi:hypothetical protein